MVTYKITKQNDIQRDHLRLNGGTFLPPGCSGPSPKCHNYERLTWF